MRINAVEVEMTVQGGAGQELEGRVLWIRALPEALHR
jgi:hypothetical protein